MVKQVLWVLALVGLVAGRAGAQQNPKVEFRDGDRIAFVGNDFFDRERQAGYIETALTTRFPDKNLTFRNLGYSGDTVRADARNLCSGWAVFGPEDQGFDRLKNLVDHIKPTLVFVAYGMNESFDGHAGIEPFTQGLNRMLDMLAGSSASGARLVLISPIRHEDLGRPLPDPSEHNKNIQLYIAAMEKVAQQRGLPFINLFETLGDGTKDALATPFTSDGIHLTPYGYWRSAIVLENALGYPTRDIVASGAGASIKETILPFAPPPKGSPKALTTGAALVPGQGIVKVTNLSPGTYVLKSGNDPVATGTAEMFAKGVPILRGPGVDQEEQLRKVIAAKNFDFFNFWRPDNDTYIFGYRKREQGRNAVEIPQFEPLVAQKEAQIAKLRLPGNQTYTVSQSAK